jgi:hypothetical protein
MYTYPNIKSCIQFFSDMRDLIIKTWSNIKLDPYTKSIILNWIEFFIAQALVLDPNNDSGYIGQMKLFSLQIKNC